MALPTISDLLGLDIVYLGQPFCRVAAKTGVDLNSLDYVYLGQPFWGLVPAAVVTGYPIKRWNGSAWVAATLKYYSGSFISNKPIKVYVGGAWHDVANT